MIHYFDRDGKPLNVDEWAMKLGDDAYRSIEQTHVGEVHISTVWLGLNHSFTDGPPLIFETMVFGGGLDEEQWRYTTEDEARAGHAHAVELVELDRTVTS